MADSAILRSSEKSCLVLSPTGTLRFVSIPAVMRIMSGLKDTHIGTGSEDNVRLAGVKRQTLERSD